MCSFDWAYTLTILEINTFEDQINFDLLMYDNPNIEGKMPEGLGTISNIAVYIKTGDFALKDRCFVAFISGILATDPLY